MTSRDDNPSGTSNDAQNKIQEGLERKKIRAEIEKLSAEAEKLRSESKHFRSPAPKWLQFVPALITSFAAVIGVSYTAHQVISSLQKEAEQRRQEDQQRQEERFSKAIAQLGSSDPKQRALAVDAISDYANRDPSTKYRRVVLAQMMQELQTETDLGVLQASIQVLPQLGASALETLVKKNRQVHEHLATATGRLLGIESVLKRNTNVLGQPATDDLMAAYLFKQLPVEIAQTSLPWRDASSSDIGLFQTPDQLGIQPDFRRAFEQANKSAQTTEDEIDAERELQSSIRDLWVSTQAIVSVLKSLSGKLDGANLRKTILLHPHLAGIDLRGIDARSATWMAPVFAEADLSFADLSKAEMKYADLRHANLTGTNVAGVNFGNRDKRIEERTLTELRFTQNDVTLHGANVWEMADCYLRGRAFDSAKLQELQGLKDARQKVLDTPEAKEYLNKIPANPIDE